VAIEDSDEDFEILQRALRQARVTNPVHRCCEADQVEELLADRAHWPPILCGPYPLLTLLDLNFPGAEGQATLQRLRNDQWWQFVPVIILSTSNQPTTVAECYRLGAAGYVRKTLAPQPFVTAIQNVVTYWLETVVPPAPPGQAMPGPAPNYAAVRNNRGVGGQDEAFLRHFLGRGR
jgi:CheY-like chemotaxis protein